MMPLQVNQKLRQLKHKTILCEFFCGCFLKEKGRFDEKTGDYITGSANVVPCNTHATKTTTKVETIKKTPPIL